MLPSVVIIAFNEEENLKQLLPLLHEFEEIIIVDSNSRDNTSELCSLFPNVKLIQNEFQGFGLQKQFAVDQAKSNWVLSLDADEFPDAHLLSHLKDLFKEGQTPSKPYFVKRQLHFLGKTFKYGKESKDFQLRLFDRTRAKWANVEVHEYVQFEGISGKLNGFLEHHSYKNIDNYIGKLNRYTSLAAADKKGESSYSTITIWFKVRFSFFKSYFLQLNFLNGYAGWVWSSFSAFYTLSKYSKLNEYRKRF